MSGFAGLPYDQQPGVSVSEGQPALTPEEYHATLSQCAGEWASEASWAKIEAHDAALRAELAREREAREQAEQRERTTGYTLRESNALLTASQGRVRALQEERDKLAGALRWFASDEGWTVTPQSQTDGRYQFNPHPDSVYATPWGFAREALVGLPE